MTDIIPHDALSKVGVAYPSPMPTDGALDDGVAYLAFDRDGRGQLATAKSFGPSNALLSDVGYTYDSLGNLASETLDPDPGSAASLAKTVGYGWAWIPAPNGVGKINRLFGMAYPSASRALAYQYDATTWDNAINRMSGINIGVDPIIHYATTGGGRNITQTWGAEKIKLDYAAASKLDRFGRIKTMDFRKIVSGGPDLLIHKYEYGYDANGNRIFNRNEQAGHIDERDYLYGYDRLNRLTFAERGELVYNNGWTIRNTGKGRAWNLDLLGNWSGSPSDNKSVVDYTLKLASAPGFTPGVDTVDAFTHHDTDATNKITTHSFDDTPSDASPPVNTDFYHDDAGNLVLDDKQFYKYDAWNRIAEVYENDHPTDPLGVDLNGNLTGTPGTLVVQYDYDALGRRIAKTLGTATSPTDYFYYDGHRVIEHHQHDGTTLSLHRQYVYGLNYIDEVVGFYDDAATPAFHYVFQDAGYNVVGVTNDQGTLEEQYSFKPYGERLAIEDGAGAAVTSGVAMLSLGYVGLWHDEETETVHNRYRTLFSSLGRYGQGDPNGTSLVLQSSLSYNAANPIVTVSMAYELQYADGMNFYNYLRSNPINGHDPMGLFSDFDFFAEADEIELELTGQKLYTLGAINEGARWASLGLQTTLDIGSALLGVDVFQSVAVLASGRGGFWDSMNIMLSVAPFGALAKVGGKLAKAFKTARRAGKSSRLARSAARHLFKILPYNQARKLTKGQGGDIMAHHILEVRHLKRWGRSGEIATAPAVILTRNQHQMITNKLQRMLPPRVRHEPDEVMAVYRQVYTEFGFAEWLGHIERYFK